MTQLVGAEIYSELPKVERTAAKSSKETVFMWGKELAWNTHKAVNQRYGEWVDTKKAKNHIWNDEL